MIIEIQRCHTCTNTSMLDHIILEVEKYILHASYIKICCNDNFVIATNLTNLTNLTPVITRPFDRNHSIANNNKYSWTLCHSIYYYYNNMKCFTLRILLFGGKQFFNSWP